MKKFMFIFLLTTVMVFSWPKKTQGGILELFETAKNIINNAIDAIEEYGKYAILVQELYETYDVIDAFACYKTNFDITLDFQDRYHGGCFANIRYENYLAAYNSMLHEVEVVLITLTSLMEESSDLLEENEGGNTPIDQLVFQITETCREIQKVGRTVMDLMRQMNFSVTSQASKEINMEIMRGYTVNAGKATIIFD